MEKRLFIQGGIAVIALIYTFVLLSIQVLNPEYKGLAESNIIQRIEESPLRGMIFDRNGKVLVRNKPIFEVKVIPRALEIKDTADFCQLLSITEEEFIEKIKKARRYSSDKPSTLINDISQERYATIQDRINEFPGLIPEVHTIRDYPHKSLANVLGYVKEVDKRFLERDTTNQYKQGDLVGKSGLERYYEPYLRGKPGVTYVMTNVKRVVKGSFHNGESDTLPVFGIDLRTTIDLEIQQYAEKLMAGKIGSVVAIEPASGEILAMLSAPSYDPNLLSGESRDVNKNYLALSRDEHNPLFNRAIQSFYPPGSTFKTLVALVGLQEGVLDTAHTYFSCNKNLVGCHNHKSPLSLGESIQHSCNPFYFQALKKVVVQKKEKDRFQDTEQGLNKFADYLGEFGLGRKLQVDLPFEKSGLIPSGDYYSKRFKRAWKFANVASISIGQGEVSEIPLQLANQAAIIANRGWYYSPHFVKAIGDTLDELPRFKVKNTVGIDKVYFDFVAKSMGKVVSAGTARLARVPDVQVAGKTGTAQNPHGEDHSIFMAFAPLEDPKIAIAVYVENAGFGGTWAAPIASLIIEKYLKGAVDPSRVWLEQYILNKNFIEEAEKKQAALAKQH